MYFWVFKILITMQYIYIYAINNFCYQQTCFSIYTYKYTINLAEAVFIDCLKCALYWSSRVHSDKLIKCFR